MATTTRDSLTDWTFSTRNTDSVTATLGHSEHRESNSQEGRP